jgi:hypothetical protein
MENRMVIVLAGFVFTREINIYRGEECVEHVSCGAKDLETLIISLAVKYGIHKISFVGDNYLIDKEKKTLMTKYRHLNFEIDTV